MDEVVVSGRAEQATGSKEDHSGNLSKRSRRKQVDGPHLDRLPLFNTMGAREARYVLQALRKPLSGYLGGNHTGGYWIERLRDEWQQTFKVEFAIPCNSATSGLLAACLAVDIAHGDLVYTTPYTMSATAACAKILGARVEYIDIEPLRYSINMNMLAGKPLPKAIIVTNLFGHPAYLHALRLWCDSNGVFLIEDNAQSPLAMESGKYAGTIGHVGVFSLNIHKHIQCGEGGVVVTNDDSLAASVYDAINHGELCEGGIGLNLRMTEPTAAIACAQLSRLHGIVESRREIGQALTEMVRDIPGIHPPEEDIDCKHVYYLWVATSDDAPRIASEMQTRGVPIRHRYSPLLTKIFGGTRCLSAEKIDDCALVFEVCAYDPKSHHLKQLKDIFHYVADKT